MGPGPDHETGLERELLDGAVHGLAGEVLVDAGQLEQDAAGLDHGNPVLGVTLAGTHAGLAGLLGNRPVREDPDPHLAATLDVAGHGDTGGLDLACRHPGRLECLDPEVTEGDLAPTLGLAG